MPQREEAKRQAAGRGAARMIVKCALFALAVTTVLLALAALLTVNGMLSPDNAIWAVFIAETAGAFTGGKVAAKRAASCKLPVAALTGLCFFGFLLVFGFMFAFPPARHLLLVLPLAVLPSMLGALEKSVRARR
ncbi:MAG: TIGR04086 family membrane protein [Oscillospiraceae bacterium]|nr:TIGR04086 family membrane protein [Oscillospiraceae bacterium]